MIALSKLGKELPSEDCSTVPRPGVECGLGFGPLLISVCGYPGRVIGREEAQGGETRGPHRAHSCNGRRSLRRGDRASLGWGVDMEEGARRSCQTTIKTSQQK